MVWIFSRAGRLRNLDLGSDRPGREMVAPAAIAGKAPSGDNRTIRPVAPSALFRDDRLGRRLGVDQRQLDLRGDRVAGKRRVRRAGSARRADDDRSVRGCLPGVYEKDGAGIAEILAEYKSV
jgi:hypothetical protein